ncbi:hypothetical protein Nepgr_025342 [Nepenthes gracilis]|uniref:Uncharacterized protein n=1 Tax=Nepenthes gracilis TaxID=150966 RepID=A0AAD3T655_NEPGR|nr:hypothetical protein Nepgr_025342 [Nepenthes gracilis]
MKTAIYPQNQSGKRVHVSQSIQAQTKPASTASQIRYRQMATAVIKNGNIIQNRKDATSAMPRQEGEPGHVSKSATAKTKSALISEETRIPTHRLITGVDKPRQQAYSASNIRHEEQNCQQREAKPAKTAGHEAKPEWPSKPSQQEQERPAKRNLPAPVNWSRQQSPNGLGSKT